jgi:hypothetical protein
MKRAPNYAGRDGVSPSNSLVGRDALPRVHRRSARPRCNAALPGRKFREAATQRGPTGFTESRPRYPFHFLCALLALGFALAGTTLGSEVSREQTKIRIEFGHRSPERTNLTPRCVAGSPGVEVDAPEKSLSVGAGVVDSLTAEVRWVRPTSAPRKPHSTWQYLLDHGTPDQVTRLRDDSSYNPDAPVLTVLTAPDGTRGFSMALEPLIRHQALWLPEPDAFITLANQPVSLENYLATRKGERLLDRIRQEPEATLADFQHRWEDAGNPTQWTVPWQSHWLGTTGHLVGAGARHGSLYKFGVDRWASVRPDHASPHRFRFDPLWPGCQWLAQHITDGWPIIVTELERREQHCRIEQFAAPLRDRPPTRRGEIPSVFLSRIQMTGTGPVQMGFRLATENRASHPALREIAGRWCVVDRESGGIWLMIEPEAGLTLRPREPIADDKDPRLEFDCLGEVTPDEHRAVVLKLASPVVTPDIAKELATLGFYEARTATIRYWSNWLEQGAQFAVPEKPVNDLFRANLWHALMLPRFREPDRIDLPYSNFAYGQTNADWPINQAVYVDYMLYGLRGYDAVAEEELAAMFRSQQRPDGRIGGFAEWGVYSPAMLYAIGQNYLLSGNRAAFDRLLPAALNTLDWCLAEVRRAQTSTAAPGLIVAPLNDLTHDARAWAFPNAYYVAGLEIFGRALATAGHPRAESVQAVARKMRADVERAFARASVKSPVVQLADGTWINYVPTDAMTPRRRLEDWYPTDVDCGPLHLARLSTIDPRGWLTTAILHDHEDNLFLRQSGMANEPVYNPQGTAHLLRDEPEAAIRTFYSMTACAFSHHQLSPLEHRWAWGQYFGPPSTDGAWFELYRNLLLNELNGDLFIGQAIPRAWLADGQQIAINRAPTYFGPVNIGFESGTASGWITAQVEFTGDRRPPTLRIRFRHPEKKTLRSVSVNGINWTDFDADKEWVRLPAPAEKVYVVRARYAP